MYRTLLLSILLCFVTFQVGITNSTPADPKPEDVTPLAPIGPTVRPYSSTIPPNSTTTVPPSNTTTTVPPTNTTTTAPPTTTTPTPITTVSTTSIPPNTTTTKPTAPTTAPPVPSTNGTSTTASPPAPSPSPSPSDRKFDAFSFLGGFALGLGLVAIGFLSWKFYLSRREDYYHTL